MTDLVHKNGANIIAQLHKMRDNLDISVDEIHKISDSFAEAAIRAKKADLTELKFAEIIMLQ